MSRSGYVDDYDEGNYLNLWRGSVKRAIRGRRGQNFLREMLTALDALPEKRLIARELAQDSEVCAIGSVGLARQVDMTTLDPEEPEQIAKAFGIAPALVREIEYINDEDGPSPWDCSKETPEQRYERVRLWVVNHITKGA